MTAQVDQLTSKQANIYTWGWQKSARFRAVRAGRRFGKTFLTKAEIRRAARYAMTCGVSVENEIWYCAPTLKQAKAVFWRRLKSALPRKWLLKKPNESELTVELKTGHVIKVQGLQEYDNLRGAGLFFVVIDEVADIDPIAWTEIIRPMLATCKFEIDGEKFHGGHALFIGTPKGYNHFWDFWQYTLSKPDWRGWHYTSLQGGNTTIEEVENARETLDRKSFSQEWEANFETSSGNVYYEFDRVLNGSDEVANDWEDLFIGMDFNVRNMSATVAVERGNEPHVVDEFSGVLDTKNMIEEIKARYPSNKRIFIYPDSSGKNTSSKSASLSDISMLEDAGFICLYKSTNPRVKDRINAMNSLICSGSGKRTLRVNAKRCPKLVECLERQQYDDKGEPDKKGGFDHMNDAIGYYVAYEFPVTGEFAIALRED